MDWLAGSLLDFILTDWLMMTDWLKNIPMGRGNLSSVTAVQNLSTNWKNTISRIVPLKDLKQYQRTCKMIPLGWLNCTKLNAENYNLRCIAYSGEVKGLSVNSSACLNKRSNCSDWRACQHRKKIFINWITCRFFLQKRLDILFCSSLKLNTVESCFFYTPNSLVGAI